MTSPHRILIVDDYVDAVEALVYVLQRDGHDVRGATTGREGLAVAETFAPDIGLLDVDLPDISGHVLAAEIRRLPGGARPYLVAITGWDDDRRHAAALAAGFDQHVLKPLTGRALTQLIQTAAEAVAMRDAG